MNPTRILKQTQRNTMHRRITPSLVEEPTRTIQMIEIILVRLTPPERHIRNLEITPEMTRTVSIRLIIMLWSPLAIRQPLHRIIFMKYFRMPRHKLHGLGPKGSNRLRRIVKVDREAVGLVVVRHVAEDVVIDIAEEMDFGLDAPVELCVFECWVFVEETTIPAAHLVVGFHGPILDVLFFEDFGRFIE